MGVYDVNTQSWNDFDKYSNEEKVLELESLSDLDREEILSDMQDWETYMFCKEPHERSKVVCDDPAPVRNYSVAEPANTISYSIHDEQSKTKENSLKSGNMKIFTDVIIRSRENWDEEVNPEEAEHRKERIKIEKAKGNDAYKQGKYAKACIYYSNCIALGYCLDAYNNRAQANMKMLNFKSAISDLNEVLSTQPTNVKALFRRATCRLHLKMYREALKDVDTTLKNDPDSATFKALREEIERGMRNLKGKTYRLRENFEPRASFSVDVSQLPVYAEANKDSIDYLIEVDRTGCSKSCVCDFCTHEDRMNCQSYNGLRIKEPPRWKPLSFDLLNEMKIDSNIPTCPINAKATSNECVDKVSTVKVVNVERKEIPTVSNRKSKNIGKTSSVAGKKDKPESKASVLNSIKDLNVSNNLVQNSSDAKATRINLNEVQLNSFAEAYDDKLNEPILTDFMKSLFMDFDPINEWNLISEYLKKMADLKEFNRVIKLVDKRARNDVLNLLDRACQQNLDKAVDLKKLYS